MLQWVKRWGGLVGKTLAVVLVLDASLLIGCLAYDVLVGDGEIPKVRMVGNRPAIARMALVNRSSNCCRDLGNVSTMLWQIHPEAAKWFRDEGMSGRIDFSCQRGAYIAIFDALTRRLTVYQGFWSLLDGEKAAVIVHEYRHSRQNYAKWILQVHAKAVGGDWRTIEQEAEELERQAYLSLGMVDNAADLMLE